MRRQVKRPGSAPTLRGQNKQHLQKRVIYYSDLAGNKDSPEVRS